MTHVETTHATTREPAWTSDRPAFTGLDVLGFIVAVVMVLGPMVPMATIASYPGMM